MSRTAEPTTLQVEYEGAWHRPDPGERFSIGRGGDLAVDDNPYLHRRFLELSCDPGFWTLANIGDRIVATLADPEARLTAHLGPGAVLPLVLPRTLVRFGAGSTTYELLLLLEDAPFVPASDPADPVDGTRTRGAVILTPDQRRCVVALAEPALSRGGTGPSHLPASKDAARRLGWTVTKFNRKLDNVCDKLSRAGVDGLHGGVDNQASNRRARLVEHAIGSGLVSADDLEQLPPRAS